MIKYLIFLFLFFPSVCFGIMPAILEAVGASAAVESNASVIFWWEGEATDFSAQNGTTEYAAVDDTMTVTSAASINAGAKYSGTNGLDIPTSYDNMYCTAQSATMDDDGSLSFWFKYTTWADGAVITTTYQAYATNMFSLTMSSSDELTFNWIDGGTTRTAISSTTSPVASTGTWYHIKMAWKTSTNYREVWVNNVSVVSTTSETINSFASAVAFNLFGNNNTNGADFFIDHVIISTDSTDDHYAWKDSVNYSEFTP